MSTGKNRAFLLDSMGSQHAKTIAAARQRKVRAGTSIGNWEIQPGVSPALAQQKVYRRWPQGTGKVEIVR
jgi:hypothetical protein